MKQLRNMNTYVRATMSDWHSKCHLNAHSPLESSPCILESIGTNDSEVNAGTSSFGMSGVNANAIIQQLSNHGYIRQEAVTVILAKPLDTKEQDAISSLFA